VLVDVPAEPQELDVGVADVLLAAHVVVRVAAPVRQELRARAAILVEEAEQQRDPAKRHQHDERQGAEPAGRAGTARARRDVPVEDVLGHRPVRHP
jgi:hypothetical protein